MSILVVNIKTKYTNIYKITLTYNTVKPYKQVNQKYIHDYQMLIY